MVIVKTLGTLVVIVKTFCTFVVIIKTTVLCNRYQDPQ